MNIKMFSGLVPDVRNAKNKRYNVEDIVFIAMVSVLCGAETWEEIEMFGKCNESYFKERIPTLKGIPSHDTFNNFFKVLDIEWFEECFRIWVDEICSRIPGVVAIDGKAVCKNPEVRKNGMKNRLYMVSAWSAANGICLGQRKVDCKSNEITAIPELINELDLSGCIVTIDAAGCQKEISKAIINSKADYILCVKDNQKNIKEHILFNLSDDMRLELGHCHNYFEKDNNHGRTEYRECVCTEALTPRIYFPGWKGVQTIAKITYVRTEGDNEPTTETRCYITSLPQDPKLILQSIRSHWQVENKLHWQLDVSFREDYTRKTNNAAINFSAMCKIALMLLKQSDLKIGIAGKRKICGWDEKFRDKILGIDFIRQNR